MNANVNAITEGAGEHIERIQTELNDLIVKHTDDTLSLIAVASVLFSSSLKCYEVALGSEGLVKFLEQALTATKEKQKTNYH
jgi:hypothetical protein